MWSYNCIYITFSKIFDNEGNILTGLKFDFSVEFFILWTGTMFDNSKESGQFLFFIASLMQFVRKEKEKSHSFKMFSGISSTSCFIRR